MRFGKGATMVLLAAGLAGCAPLGLERIDPDISRYPALSQRLARTFPIGAAAEPWQLETREGQVLAWHFNSLVAENVMKPPHLQPAEGKFEFGAADRLVEFAERRGMKIRGHTLVWHEETPAWFWRGKDNAPATAEQVLERLRTHIQKVVGRYRGRVYAWDVVNEVIDPDLGDCLRDDPWRRVVGPGYIEAAFRFAHEADPAAKLFINDFETTDPRKRDCLERVVRDLLARGVPVHGVGHQMHVDLDRPTIAEVDEALARFTALGVENQVTELDVSMRAAIAGAGADPLTRQAARYEELFAAFGRGGVKAVTLWGISDAHTWRNMGKPATLDRPLLFDVQQRPKPAYFAIARHAAP